MTDCSKTMLYMGSGQGFPASCALVTQQSKHRTCLNKKRPHTRYWSPWPRQT